MVKQIILQNTFLYCIISFELYCCTISYSPLLSRAYQVYKTIIPYFSVLAHFSRFWCCSCKNTVAANWPFKRCHRRVSICCCQNCFIGTWGSWQEKHSPGRMAWNLARKHQRHGQSRLFLVAKCTTCSWLQKCHVCWWFVFYQQEAFVGKTT